MTPKPKATGIPMENTSKVAVTNNIPICKGSIKKYFPPGPLLERASLF